MRGLIILLILLISSLSKAQETGNIISASGEAKGVSISASWAIGEVINETFKSSSLEVSHGLNDQNFKYVITGSIALPRKGFPLSVRYIISKATMLQVRKKFWVESLAS